MKIESDILKEDKIIPTKYSCYGDGLQLPLKISGVPEEAKSLALIVDDPDAPSGDFVHWVVWNIDPAVTRIENISSLKGATEGRTSLDKPGYIAPCPPSGIHHYNFNLYALDTTLSIPESYDKLDLLGSMEDHTLESAKLVALYGK